MTVKISIETEELNKARRVLDNLKIEGEIGENYGETFDEEIEGHFVEFLNRNNFNEFMNVFEPLIKSNSHKE